MVHTQLINIPRYYSIDIHKKFFTCLLYIVIDNVQCSTGPVLRYRQCGIEIQICVISLIREREKRRRREGSKATRTILLGNFAVTPMSSIEIIIGCGDTPPVSTAHNSTLPTSSVTLYVFFSNDSLPAINT